MSVITNGLSGVIAAQTRLNVSASNTANIRSTADEQDGVPVNKPYQAQQIQETSLATGGVQSVVLPVKPSSLPIYDPQSSLADEQGIVQTPNVSQDNERVQQIIANRSYEANLKSIETYQQVTDALLNIVE